VQGPEDEARRGHNPSQGLIQCLTSCTVSGTDACHQSLSNEVRQNLEVFLSYVPLNCVFYVTHDDLPGAFPRDRLLIAAFESSTERISPLEFEHCCKRRVVKLTRQ